MSHPNPSTALGRAVMDELAVCGVEVVVVSPGSRSAALAIAAYESPHLDVRVVIDERSAGFHALGVARAGGKPAAVVSTSGTAVANYLPAVVEADMACVPLVVISADRPAEMHGVGANQTIVQAGIFGDRVRAESSVEAPEAGVDGNAGWRDAVRTLVTAARGPRPGPVHLNVAFREPTVPVTDDGRTWSEPYLFATPRIERGPVPAPPEEHLVPSLPGGRGLVVAGDGEYDRAGLSAAAAAIGWPVLATALSGMRGGDAVTSYHHLLVDGIPSRLRPDTVVAVGSIGPSPALEALVSSAERRVRVDRWGRHIDPGRDATEVLAADPVAVVQAVGGDPIPDWRETWHESDRRCRDALLAVVGCQDRMTGAGVAVALNDVRWGALVAASSLPIREVDAHVTRAGPVFANRGASGIDGFVSTALGVASVLPRTVAYAGDLSVLHDSNGFLTDAVIDLVVVVIDNRGGGLFDSLPLARHAPGYERLFVTDPRRDLERLAVFHSAGFCRVGDVAALVGAVGEALDRGGIEIVCVPVDRAHDLAVRSQLGR